MDRAIGLAQLERGAAMPALPAPTFSSPPARNEEKFIELNHHVRRSADGSTP